MKVFETIKPKSNLLAKYISYYYFDIADAEDYANEYICYPHYNNTITIYKSHHEILRENHSIINFKNQVVPLQLFTPLRENILKVTQNGPVHKIGIVFEPFGINQFLSEHIPLIKTTSSPEFIFFDNEFILNLFNQSSFNKMVELLDEQLIKKMIPVDNQYITKAIHFLHSAENDFSIDDLAEIKLGISRKHLNRLFNKYLGTSVQKYRSIVRFRQLMNHKLDTKEYNNFSALSHQAHYTDQSHFIKACKQLTGLTPSQFFREGKIIGSEDTFWRFSE